MVGKEKSEKKVEKTFCPTKTVNTFLKECQQFKETVTLLIY